MKAVELVGASFNAFQPSAGSTNSQESPLTVIVVGAGGGGTGVTVVDAEGAASGTVAFGVFFAQEEQEIVTSDSNKDMIILIFFIGKIHLSLFK